MNNRLLQYISLAIIGCIAYACKPTAVAVASDKEYYEDLSGYRRLPSITTIENFEIDTATNNTEPAGPLVVNNDINQLLAQFSDSLAELNRKNGFIQGYTVQVYSGSSREAANKAKQQVYMVSPNAEPEVKWVSPNYKVKVGLFTEQLKAQKLYLTLREAFPGAILIPERIAFND